MTVAPRVAVVGSGPSGLYMVEALAKAGIAEIDVIERLPCPYGLLRYGVAPDHSRIKALTTAMCRILERPGVRFLGGVEFGVDVTAEELRGHYGAVVYATGAPSDRRLGIPGEELPGSLPAGRFVSWYSGHPDAVEDLVLDAQSAVVFGMGNVALDTVRMLTKEASELAATDVPDEVLARLNESRVTDVYVIGRRGPLQARFSTKELREIAALESVDIVVDPGELRLSGREEAGPEPLRNLELFEEWSRMPSRGRPRRVHFRFGLEPVALQGRRSVEAIQLRRMAPGGDGVWAATGEEIAIEAQLALRSVGYRGVPLPGLPFDESRGVVPHEKGRVLRPDRAAGEYVVGWIKRGPTGVIGTNKADAQETAATVLADLPRLTGTGERPARIDEVLHRRGAIPVTWDGWRRIDAAEIDGGVPRSAARVKIRRRDDLLAIASGGVPGSTARERSKSPRVR